MIPIGKLKKIDNIGRVAFSRGLLENFNLQFGDHIEVLRLGNDLVLRKYDKTCVFCNGIKNLIRFKGSLVCRNCVTKVKNGEYQNNYQVEKPKKHNLTT